MIPQQVELPSWDRFLAEAGAMWDDRVRLLRAADEELRETARRGARLVTLDHELAHWTAVRDEARREILDLERRKAVAVDRAVEETGQRSIIGRAKRQEAARQWADEMQEEQLKGTRQIVSSRLAHATRELTQMQDEVRTFGMDPMYRDEQQLAWLHAIHEVVLASTKRDVRARDLVLRPWLRQRAADLALVTDLRQRFDELVPGAAFAQGCVHLVGGEQFAVVEARDGNDRIMVTGNGDSQRLLQPSAGGDVPAGATTGATTGLVRLAQLASEVAGATAQPIICFLQWKQEPAKVGDIILCGPNLLADVLLALPAQEVEPAKLAEAAERLALEPVTKVQVTDPAPLEEFATIAPDDVPRSLVQLAELVEAAHVRTIDLRDSVAVFG